LQAVAVKRKEEFFLKSKGRKNGETKVVAKNAYKAGEFIPVRVKPGSRTSREIHTAPPFSPFAFTIFWKDTFIEAAFKATG
jgi:hypothetical protein